MTYEARVAADCLLADRAEAVMRLRNDVRGYFSKLHLMYDPRFLPICKEDLEELGWDYVDVIIISADAYVDHP